MSWQGRAWGEKKIWWQIIGRKVFRFNCLEHKNTLNPKAIPKSTQLYVVYALYVWEFSQAGYCTFTLDSLAAV